MSRNNVSTELLDRKLGREVDEWHQAYLKGDIEKLGEVTDRMTATDKAIESITGVYTENILDKKGGIIDVMA